MPEASHTFDAQAGSVREARHFLRACLESWQAEGFGLSGEQVVSELATNAALHARSDYVVHLRLDPGSLRVEVSDASPAMPHERHYADDATTGRGLRLVAALSEDWGARAGQEGKTVWCRIDADGDLSALFDDSLHDTDDVTGPAGWTGGGRGRHGGTRALAA